MMILVFRRLLLRALFTLTTLFMLATAAAASTVTVSSTTISGWQHPSTAPTLRIYLSKRVVTSANAILQPGSPQGGVFYKSITCSASGGVLTIPQTTIDSLTDALAGSDAKYSAFFYSGNTQLQPYQGFTSFSVPALPATTTWADLLVFNAANVPFVDSLTYSRTQIDAKLAVAAGAPAASPFIIKTPSAPLTGAFALSSLSDGLLKHTGGTPARAVPGTDYQLPGNYITALTGDGTASGPGSAPLTLATVNGNVGSFTNASITVDAKGRVTAASSGTAGLADPMTTRGDMIVRNSGNVSARLALGASGTYPRSNGSDLVYSTIQAGDIPSLSATYVDLSSIQSIAGAKTFTGNLTAPLFDRGGQVYNVVSYGADPTGVADSRAAFIAARDAATAARKGIVYVPPGWFALSDQFDIGDGTNTTVSTYHGIRLVMAGGTRLNSTSTNQTARLFRTGGSTNPIIRVRGPIGGVTIEGGFIDCVGTAGKGIEVMHAEGTIIRGIQINEFTSVGLDIDAYDTTAFGAQTVFNSGNTGYVENLFINSLQNNSTAVRLGNTGNVAQWNFVGGRWRLDGTTGSTVVELGYADHNNFYNVTGKAAAGVRMKARTGHESFPVNNFFWASSVQATSGSNAYVIDNSVATWNPTSGYGQPFIGLPTADGSVAPTDTRLWGFTDQQEMIGAWSVKSSAGLSFKPHGTSAGNTTETRYMELAANGSNYVGFKAPDSLAGNTVYTLPTGFPASNMVLQSTSAGVLSWVAAGGGGGSPGGSDTHVQFNDGGAFGGDAGFVYSKSTDTATLGVIQLTNAGLKVLDSDATHYLSIVPGSNLSAARTLTITTGDAGRTLTLSGDATVSQDYSTTGSPQFAGLTLAGNLTYSGNARRIIGDFSNATSSNLTMFQSSTTNGSTIVAAVPNGTSVFSGWRAYSGSDVDNASYIEIFTNGTFNGAINVGHTGSGTTPPFTVFKDGSTSLFQVGTNGHFSAGNGGGDFAFFNVTGGIALAINTTAKTSNYTATDTDATIRADSTSGAVQITLPTAVGANGREYTVIRINGGGNNVTVVGTSSQTMSGATTKTLGAQWSSMTVRSDGSNWIIVATVGTVT